MNLEEAFHSYGLSYHHDHLTTAIAHCGPLAGKAVFEIGGCLPREIVCELLQARQWIGLEHPAYWDVSGDDNPSRRIEVRREPLQDFDPSQVEHVCLEGDILDLPESLFGKFDLVFSTSALEHVADLRGTLAMASSLLRSGGKLFAVAMPIWTSSRGHHLPPIKHQGEVMSFLAPPFEDWAHLFMTPHEMAATLGARLPNPIVQHIVEMCYYSPHINRAFVEDYEDALTQAAFSERRIMRVPDRDMPDDVRSKIALRHPGRRLDQYGVCLFAIR